MYESNQTRTILNENKLKLDQGITFSFYPYQGGKNLLELESEKNKHASILFYPLTIFAFNYSLSLNNGQLLIDRRTFIEQAGGASITGSVFYQEML